MKLYSQISTFTMLSLVASLMMVPGALASLRGARTLGTATNSEKLHLNVDCIPPFGDTCDSIPQYTPQCQHRPSTMTFRYKGGDCLGSYNAQAGGGTFECEDFQGGPPSQNGTRSYIKAIASSNEKVHFSGFVNVGDQFTLSPEHGAFAADMNITIYNPGNFTELSDIVNYDNMIQTVLFHSSCDLDLYLMDQFGSVQLVEFFNEEEGTVTAVQDVTLGFTIYVTTGIEGGGATLSGLIAVSTTGDGNSDVIILNDHVTKELESGMPIYVTGKFTIDLSTRQNYTVVGTVAGNTYDGTFCAGSNIAMFTAGYVSP